MLHSTQQRMLAATSFNTNNKPTPGTTANNKSDSNVDTCCVGEHFVALNYTNHSVNVMPYNSEYIEIQDVPIVIGATAFDTDDGTTVILVINQGLYFGTSLDYNLLNPN